MSVTRIEQGRSRRDGGSADLGGAAGSGGKSSGSVRDRCFASEACLDDSRLHLRKNVQVEIAHSRLNFDIAASYPSCWKSKSRFQPWMVQEVSMRCFQHNEREAVGTCMTCGAGGCGECLIHYSGAKMCKGCADHVYVSEVAATRDAGQVARKRLIRLAVICAFFFCTSLLVWQNVLMALFSAYGWGSVYMGTMPFVRAIGSRLSGGAISTSVTGALFGTLGFWIVAGWWLLFLGMLYSYLGGGIFHTLRALQRWRSAEARASSIPPPGVASGMTMTAGAPGARPPQGANVPPSKGYLRAALPAVAALLCVGYCSSQSLSNRAGCGAPSIGEPRNEASLIGVSDSTPRVAATPPVVPASPPSTAVAAPAAPPAAPLVLAAAKTSPALSPIEDLLGRYYSDLNSNQFDANRYFEPQVERYITMMNTSTGAMNNYIRTIFPKQFKEYTFSLEPGSLVATQPSQYEYVERSEYFMVAKKKTLKQRVMVRITVSRGGKLTFLEQYKRLPWEELKTPPL